MVNVFIKRPVDVIPLLKKWAGDRQENFILITLNGSHKVIKVHLLTRGLANRTIIHPREAFFPAIVDNAVSIMFAHNHPSGETKVSSEDISITERLQASSELLGFHLLDHIIFTKSPLKWVSLREECIITDSGQGV